MTSNLVFARNGKSIRKLFLLNDGVFLIYAPRKRRFPCPEFTKYDTEIVVTLPDNLRGFFCSKYRYNKKELSCKKEEL